ncbi:MAG: hypothetical protein ACI93R_002087 [Flavobacteriales bacterium]|jgi:uncharacterized protein (DUF924 family)
MYTAVIEFWFKDIDKSQWWVKDENFDKLIHTRFLDLHKQAINCELYEWRKTALGRLAEVIVLDQFSRNIYRDMPQAFAYDAQALVLSQEAIAGNIDHELSLEQRSFLYMPFMHSESAVIHKRAEAIFSDLGVESTLKFEQKHKEIIDRFGRYPHRNKILNRESSEEERVFLTQPGSSF